MSVYKHIDVESFKVGGASGKSTTAPFVRITLDGEGCPLPGCMCSGDNYLSLSDGEVGLCVKLTPSQVEQLVTHGTLWLDDEKGVGRNTLAELLEDFSPY